MASLLNDYVMRWFGHYWETLISTVVMVTLMCIMRECSTNNISNQPLWNFLFFQPLLISTDIRSMMATQTFSYLLIVTLLSTISWVCDKTFLTVSHKYFSEIRMCSQILNISFKVIGWGKMVQLKGEMAQDEGENGISSSNLAVTWSVNIFLL